MPNDNMQFYQEDMEQNWIGATSPETGGRNIPGYFYDAPQATNQRPNNSFPQEPTAPPDLAPQESPEAVGNPQNNQEVYGGSFQAALQNNLGYFVVIEFLIGTNGLTEKEGILFAVGNNFVTLYEQETDRYIVCDLFSIKFVTFFRQSPTYIVSPNAVGTPRAPRSYGGMVPRNY